MQQCLCKKLTLFMIGSTNKVQTQEKFSYSDMSDIFQNTCFSDMFSVCVCLERHDLQNVLFPLGPPFKTIYIHVSSTKHLKVLIKISKYE